jgi:hypothetical protein
VEKQTVSNPTTLAEQFPPDRQWPVVPPDEHWLKRWHWLKDEEGCAYLAFWYHKGGWHGGWNGKIDPDDMEGWSYIALAVPPVGDHYVR